MKKILSCLFLVAFLSACGSTPQPTVSLSTNMIGDGNARIGVVYETPEKAETHIYGAACLLCYGIASSLTSSLDKHLKSITSDDLKGIEDAIMMTYKKKSNNVKKVTLPQKISKLAKFKGELGYAKKDFRGLKKALNIDVLVVANITQHGAYRSFSNYIPNGDPMGYVNGLIYAIDLKTNKYIQYRVISEKIQPEGEWDEPPLFPGVTTSYYQAVENVKDIVTNSL